LRILSSNETSTLHTCAGATTAVFTMLAITVNARTCRLERIRVVCWLSCLTSFYKYTASIF
jgi:hypothetical protein